MATPEDIESLLTEIMNLFADTFREQAILRGGMVLRLLDSPRLTNDLDYLFIPYKSKNDITEKIIDALSTLPNVTLNHSLNSKCLRVRVARGDIIAQVEAKVDMACSAQALSTSSLASLHNQTPRIIAVMDYKVSLANKLAAWYERRLIRDLYDIYFYTNMGISPDKTTLEDRLKKPQFTQRVRNKPSPLPTSENDFFTFLKQEVRKISDEDVRQELQGVLDEITLTGLAMKIKAVLANHY